MTEDTKKNILNYITNNITTTPPSTAEVFKEAIRNNDKWNDFLPLNYVIRGFINPTNSSLGVLYGNNTNGQNGIIILVDENFNPIKTFTQYDSGTELKYIQAIEQSNDGTFYMIDDENISNYSTSQKRFVMLNNFTVPDLLKNDYQLTLRTSYIIPVANTNFRCQKLAKNPNSAHYLMLGHNSSNNIKSIELKIEVGQPLSWSTYQTTSSYTLGDAIIDFNSDDQARIRGTIIENSSPFEKVSKLYKNYNSISFGSEVVYTSSYPINMKECIFTNYNTCYFVNDTQYIEYAGLTNQDAIELYKIDYTDNTVSKIYSQIYARVNPSDDLCYELIKMSVCEGILYVLYMTNSEPVPVVTPKTLTFYLQRMTNDIWDPQEAIDVTTSTLNWRTGTLFLTSQTFNYFKANVLSDYYGSALLDFRYIQIKENYNSLNYNGTEYIDYNSTVSKQAEVYSNNSLVFARNLYNFTINGNQNNATVVVPNTYLNNINLDIQDLLSETNTEIVSNNNTITKNIYETLYLNFINTINVIDEDLNIVYPNSASYVNENINTGTQANCEDTAITKAKITTENTTNIINISWTTIDDTHKETTFSIYVGEPILKIELISNDETTSYMTLDTSSLQTNNFYTISQKIRIE